MIVVKLLGGLGNQMFQYAFGRCLSVYHNTDLFLDITDLKSKNVNHTYRNFSLDKFHIKATIASDELVKWQHGETNIFQRALNKISHSGKLKVVSENKIHFDPEIEMPANNVYLSGYWQSPLYFNSIENIIRDDFRFSVPLSSYAESLLSKIRTGNSVSLHVRRGDYVTNPETNAYHGVSDLAYYNRAMELIRNKISNPVFYIFSDDPFWVEENFKLSESTILVSKLQTVQFDDLQLMSSCKHAIIANSSFSWWGAWLINNNPDKIVIAPLKWYQNGSINTDDLFTKSTFRT
jgi:hypothetical protein